MKNKKGMVTLLRAHSITCNLTVLDEQIFSSLSNNFFKYLLATFTDSKDSKASNMVILLALAILAYAGVEAIKLIFRNNFGSKGVSTTRFVLSVIAFLAISGASYSMYSGYDNSPMDWASKSSFLMTSLFYLFLSASMIYKGGVKKRNTEVFSSYRGDSSVLSFLSSEWKQSTIQNFAEPLLCLALGVFLLPYNMLMGIPLIFCAISGWLHVALESFANLGGLRDTLSDAMAPRNRETKFARAEN